MQKKVESHHSVLYQCSYSPWTVRFSDLESSPASLVTTHSYTAVSSTVGAITTREPDESSLVETANASVSGGVEMMKDTLKCLVHGM